MKIHRFYISQTPPSGKSTISDTGLARQLGKVLQLRKGEKITLFDGSGREVLAKIEEITGKSIGVSVLETSESRAEPQKRCTLYCAILKADHFELAAQKATEAGAESIVPLVTARTVKKDLNRDRVRKIIQEAAEQSGRAVIPSLHEPQSLESALLEAKQNSINPVRTGVRDQPTGASHSHRPPNVSTTNRGLGRSNGVNIFFDSSGQDLEKEFPDNKDIGVFIGPEGGWTEEEISQARASGCIIRNLGPRILRAETAATIAVFLATQ